MNSTALPAWLIVVLAVLPPVLVGVFTLLGVARTQKSQAKRDFEAQEHQLVRDQREDERRLRDARRERLRTAYATVLDTASRAENRSASAAVVAALAKYTKDSRWIERLDETLTQDIGSISQARTQLRLDGEGRDALDRFQAIISESTALNIAISADYTGAKQLDSEEMMARAQRMADLSEELAEFARRRLTDLEEPV